MWSGRPVADAMMTALCSQSQTQSAKIIHETVTFLACRDVLTS
ncbi:hypothetical protein AtDm6_1430 [Acetobacter tropicalis]|uniref:Uncharacterized protein n=1 Tax=Acetobacter tropicalis TaxID=104102 RepID=A0A094YTQ8_9PROT|nr:hypothetical protein AtDm6_1430 [Acetobacter tropicalis]